jgi:hypothetical protein
MDAVEVLLQSGRKDPRIHRFYESCGFEPRVRTAYLANRPPRLNLIAGRPNWNGGPLCQSAPQQKDYNNDHQYRAEAPTKIMVGSAEIETTATKKENQNDQE